MIHMSVATAFNRSEYKDDHHSDRGVFFTQSGITGGGDGPNRSMIFSITIDTPDVALLAWDKLELDPLEWQGGWNASKTILVLLWVVGAPNLALFACPCWPTSHMMDRSDSACSNPATLVYTWAIMSRIPLPMNAVISNIYGSSPMMLMSQTGSPTCCKCWWTPGEWTPHVSIRGTPKGCRRISYCCRAQPWWISSVKFCFVCAGVLTYLPLPKDKADTSASVQWSHESSQRIRTKDWEAQGGR